MQPSPMPRTVISDVCDTLFYSNTTFDFIAYVLDVEERRGAGVLLSVLRNRLSPLNAGLVLLNSFGNRDYFRPLGTRFLRGYRRERLDSMAQDFLTGCLLGRIVEKVTRLLLDHRQAGDRVILASSSLEPVVAAIARHFGLEYVASELDFRDGISTGRLSRELTGTKDIALARLGVHPPYDVVVTDNFSDKGLLSKAKEKVIVVYSKADERKWNIPDARLIRV